MEKIYSVIMGLPTEPSPSVSIKDSSFIPDVTLDDAIGQLNSPHAKVLLDTIDSLRELRVGEIVQLPQIIVVGDQSSGKSSVLEAVSGMKFPVHGNLCTRFATELILRRDRDIKVTVSIQKATQAESTPFHRTSFNRDALPDIIEEAQERMGIRTGSNEFSKDTLRVVIAGPDAPQLTLVDLPGIFHSETAEQSLQGKVVVDELVNKYMQERKSIILVVVAANNQLANQSVLSLAKQHDPQSSRIVGVITKPDLVDDSANEKKYLDLCKGLESTHKLPLGWHVLRNSSEKQRNDAKHNRDLEEQRFFQTTGWASVPSASRGVESLRNKLSKVLLEHIRESLPGLIREIENSLRAREEELKQLGKSRSTPQEMRSFLLGIAEDFRRLSRDAVDGRYGDPFFGDLSSCDRKLRARLRQMNHAFDATMLSKGATYSFDWETGSDSSDNDEDGAPAHLQLLIEDYRKHFSDPLSITKLALTHASKAFVDQLFGYVIGADHDAIEAILKGCADPFFEEKGTLLEDKLQEILRPYTTTYGLPLEREFRTETSKRTLLRNSHRFVETLQRERPDLFHQESGFDPKTILQSVINAEKLTKGDYGTEQIIHMIVVHYEMSRRTFIENVLNLAVENCLIDHIPSILTPIQPHRSDKGSLLEQLNISGQAAPQFRLSTPNTHASSSFGGVLATPSPFSNNSTASTSLTTPDFWANNDPSTSSSITNGAGDSHSVKGGLFGPKSISPRSFPVNGGGSGTTALSSTQAVGSDM
ncbi:hypothetical protein J7T55_004488 [Diaporthe amygdali]|uniref:uncharacterized protein n=1 Tax=Phomopsis amygdali TaxID=1214568 RepID=UPI0022FE313B|nr:uncharacterized protein J7T55_004488 [Diaporthe amygdali]KAJ0114747.1 hypothetical protein J7T55_004488 [Diaporthe amygdali]